MGSTFSPETHCIDWWVASRPVAGQALSGDLHLVRAFDQGTLVAVVDGVGHGDEATAAANQAVAVLEAHPQDPVISLIKRCHESLGKSRGVVMTVASLDSQQNTLTWGGVGNVEGRLVRANRSVSHPIESTLLRAGVVGHQMPALHTGVLPLETGDLLILATDGIHAGFAEGLSIGATPRQLADRILSVHFKGTDDGLVLVARYHGKAHE